jgi:signal peptidase II
MRPILAPLGVAAALFALDKASKAWVVATIPPGVRETSLGLGFHLTHTRNPGAAFGVLRDFRVVLGPVLVDGTVLLGLLNLVVAIGIVVYLATHRGRLEPIASAALALVLAGALGNAVDRLRLGYVVDFIHFQVGWFDFPVFNVADACVVIGAGLLLLNVLRRPPPAAETTPPSAEAPAEGGSAVDR